MASSFQVQSPKNTCPSIPAWLISEYTGTTVAGWPPGVKAVGRKSLGSRSMPLKYDSPNSHSPMKCE